MAFIFEFIIINIGVLSTAIFIAIYFYFTQHFKFWQELGIPYVKPSPFVGNLKECALQKLNIGEKLQQIYNEHSDKPYVGIFSFNKPSLLIRDLELVKNVLVKDSQYFMDHLVTFNQVLDPLFARILPFLRGQRWRHLRTSLTPVFTSGKMRKMFYLVDNCGKELTDCLDRATVDGTTVDAKETMFRYATDVIASCAFGIDGHSLKDPQAEFNRHLRKMFDFSIKKGLALLTALCAPRLTSLLRLKFVDDVTDNYVRRMVWSTVEYRERNSVVRNDALDCLMEIRNRDKKEWQVRNLSAKNLTTDDEFQIDGDNFVAQALVFLIGGYETSGTILGFAMYELALNPDIQQKLRAEVLEVLNRHNGQLTYDGIQEMSYLDMVVSETMRKYPVGLFVDRLCCSDYELPAPSGNGTVTIPAGTAVYIPVLALHHDPKYYPEPEKFDPDRFTEENKHIRPKYTYLPFGEGPRMCLGIRFGLMTVKTALCHILSRFEVAPSKDTPVPIVFDPKAYVLATKAAIPLSFKRRHE